MLQPNSYIPASQRKDEHTRVSVLVEKAKAGKRWAFVQLMDRHHEDIFRMVYYRTRSKMDAEDITQDVFLQVYKNLSKLRETNRFRSWLFSIAINRVRDFHRKKRFKMFVSGSHDVEQAEFTETSEGDHSDALDGLMREDFWRQIKLYLNQLSKGEKEVFLLRFMDHLSIKEIAHALHKSESTIKTQLYRALKKFRERQDLFQSLREKAV
jgi:RNA polymerase sigma-70 factor (ECF subfamily)